MELDKLLKAFHLHPSRQLKCITAFVTCLTYNRRKWGIARLGSFEQAYNNGYGKFARGTGAILQIHSVFSKYRRRCRFARFIASPQKTVAAWWLIAGMTTVWIGSTGKNRRNTLKETPSIDKRREAKP